MELQLLEPVYEQQKYSYLWGWNFLGALGFLKQYRIKVSS